MRRLLAAIGRKSNTHVVLIILVLVHIPTIALAQIALAPLSGTQIRSSMFGKLFTGEYPNGARWAERFNTNNTSDYSENGRVTKGLMTLNGNILCFTYLDIAQSGGCFEVWKRGANCFDFYSHEENINLDSRRFGRDWQARGWVDGEPSTCMSDQIS